MGIFDFLEKLRLKFELTKINKEEKHSKGQTESYQWVTRARSAKGPIHEEVVFLSDDSPCFMIIAPFVLKVVGTRIKVVYSSEILGRRS